MKIKLHEKFPGIQYRDMRMSFRRREGEFNKLQQE